MGWAIPFELESKANIPASKRGTRAGGGFSLKAKEQPHCGPYLDGRVATIFHYYDHHPSIEYIECCFSSSDSTPDVDAQRECFSVSCHWSCWEFWKGDPLCIDFVLYHHEPLPPFAKKRHCKNPSWCVDWRSWVSSIVSFARCIHLAECAVRTRDGSIDQQTSCGNFVGSTMHA